MTSVSTCLLKHFGAKSPIAAYRAEMAGDVAELTAAGMDATAAWAKVVDAKLADLIAERSRIEQDVADAYSKTAAGKKAAPNEPAPASPQPAASPGSVAAPGSGSQEAKPRVNEAPTPRTATRRGTVMGSPLLGIINGRALNGIDPGLMSEYSFRIATKKRSARGGTIFQWRNPLTTQGMLFRDGGAKDGQLIAEVLEDAGYLAPGTVERDAIEAANQAKDLIRAALGRDEPLTNDQQIAEHEARQQEDADARRDDFAPVDDFSADELDDAGYAAASPEVQALTEQMLSEAEALGIDTEAIREDASSNTEATEDEYHAAVQAALARVIAKAQADASRSNAEAARGSGEDRGATAGDQGQEGLTLEAQDGDSLRAKTERESRAAAADKAEQKRLEDKAKADSQVGEFALTGSDRAADVGVAQGQGDIFGEPTAPAAEAEPGGTDDVGENLRYNRRNVSRGGIGWNDVENLSDALKVREVVKAKVWPKPDYASMIDAGMPPMVARAVKQMYDAIGNGPAGTTDEALKLYIDTLAKVRGQIDAWAADAAVTAALTSGDVGYGTAARASKLLEMLWPNNANAPRYARWGASTQEGQEARALGGDRFLKAIQFDRSDLTKWAKDVEGGWPASKEAWERQGYSVRAKSDALTIEEVGQYGAQQRETRWVLRSINRYLSSHATLAEAEAARDAIKYPWLVLDKSGRIVGGADSQAEAKDAARGIVKRESSSTGGSADSGFALGDAQRVGVARREAGENVSAQRLMDDFGFRGINFGRKGYIGDELRQAYLNAAWDALHDLAELTGLPAKALSLNGELGLAFGAQGRGGRAAAHFVPGMNEINLTRDAGAGTLAHEWGHALDHYFAARAGLAREADPFLSDHAAAGDTRPKFDGPRKVGTEPRFAADLRPEVLSAFKALHDAMNRRPVTQDMAKLRMASSRAKAVAGLDKWIAHMRKAMKSTDAQSEFDALADKLRAGDLGDGYVRIGRMSPLRKTVGDMALLVRSKGDRAAGIDLPSNWKGLDASASHVAYVVKSVEAQAGHVPQGETTSSTYASESASADGAKKGKKYWSTEHEKFARAFETWVSDRLKAREQANTFLSTGGGRADDTSEHRMPYPRGDEREAMARAFDTLVNELKTRTDDAGNVALYSRTGADTDEARALKALSENDELFDYPRGEGQTVEEVAASIDPGIRLISEKSDGRITRYVLRLPSGKAFSLRVRSNKAGELHPSGYYGYSDPDADPQTGFANRPGEDPDGASEGRADVIIDVSALEQGQDGVLAYLVASDYAANTGKAFIGDPQSLSDAAVLRRTEQMLSSAIKHGSTDHLAPHPRQVVGDAKLGIPPLQWKAGDTLGNIRSMVDTVVTAWENRGGAAYDFDLQTGNFLDRTGTPRDRAGMARDATEAQGFGRGAGAGYRTLARTAVWRALLREEGREGATGGRRDGLLERLVQAVEQFPAALDGTFYGRTAANNTGPTTRESLRQHLADELGADTVAALEQAGLLTISDRPAGNMPADVAGVTQNGRIGLYAANTAPGSVAVAYHEALHATLRQTIGDEAFDALMARMPALVAGNKAFFSDARIPAGTPAAALNSERASYGVEAYQSNRETMPKSVLRWVEDLIAALKAGLAKALQAAGVGLQIRVRLLSDAKVLRVIARDGLKGMAREANASRENLAPAFSRGKIDNPTGEDYGDGFWKRIRRDRQGDLGLAAARVAQSLLGRTGRRSGEFAGNQPARAATGLEPIRFKDRIAGWDDFVSIAIAVGDGDSRGIRLYVIPTDLMNSAPDAERNKMDWAERNAVLIYDLRGSEQAGVELSVSSSGPGYAAFEAAPAGSFLPTGKYDVQGREYYRVPLGLAASKDYLSEAVRRFALHYRFVPKIKYARETGASVRAETRTVSPESVEERYSKAPQTDTDIRYSIADSILNFGAGTRITGQTTRQYTPEQLASMRNVGFQTDTPSIEARIKALWKDAGKKLAQGLVDQFAPVKELSKEAYALMRLSKGASGAFETLLQGGRLKLDSGVYDFDEQHRGGVIDTLLKPLQGEHHDFFRWVAANRAERLVSEGKENLFSDDDIDNLKSLADGVAPFDYTIQHGAQAGTVTRDRTLIYADSLKTFNEFNKNVLDMAEQSGLIDGASRAIWEHDFYVPFYRVSPEEDGGVRGMNVKSGVVRQEAFKALKGGRDALNTDLLDNTLMNWAHLLDASAKNRGAKATLEAAENMGVALSSTESAAREMAAAMGKRGNVVWVMDGGEKHFYVVEDPYLMTALTALEFAGMRGPMMDAMGFFKRVLTIGVTASPFFKVRNLVRDSLQAIAVGPLGYNPAANGAQGWKLTNPKSDAYFKLLAGGGTIHFGTMMEGNEAKRVQALVESGVDSATILGSDKKVKAFYRKYIEPGITAYNELGNRGEAINRASLYAQLRSQGMSHADASLQARDLMDFSMQGSFTSIRFLTQVVPFFNARIQGLYKLGRAAKEDPARFSAVLGATALASLALLAAFSDDEDWKKREDWDRNSFWWFKFGGVAFRIPKPFEIGAIATLAERGFELAFEKEMTGQRFRQNVMQLLGDNLSMNPVPQLIKPVLDVYANKDSFTGRPIETMGMDRLRPDYRFTDRTSMAARGISTAANSVSNLVGANAPSPVQVDHLLRGYFGWLGSFVVAAGDLLARPATGQPTRPESDLFKAVTGNMVSDLRDAPSRYVSQMYQQAREIEQAYGTWKALVKEGKAGEAKEFREDNLDLLSRYRVIERAKSAETKLNQMIRQIEQGDASALEKRVRIRAINAQKEAIAKRAEAVN